MANNCKSMIEVTANDEAVKFLGEKLDLCKHGDILSFAQAFYENVEVSDDGESVMNSWSIDNLGSKWNYLYDALADDDFMIESAWYPPTDFFKHLYKMLHEIDPDVQIKVKYEDEAYNPIGAYVIKKDENGIPMSYQEEDDEMEDPTLEMDWDDEGYDDAQMDFMDSIANREDEMVEFCIQMIDDGNGDPIFKEELQTEG